MFEGMTAARRANDKHVRRLPRRVRCASPARSCCVTPCVGADRAEGAHRPSPAETSPSGPLSALCWERQFPTVLPRVFPMVAPMPEKRAAPTAAAWELPKTPTAPLTASSVYAPTDRSERRRTHPSPPRVYMPRGGRALRSRPARSACPVVRNGDTTFRVGRRDDRRRGRRRAT